MCFHSGLYFLWRSCVGSAVELHAGVVVQANLGVALDVGVVIQDQTDPLCSNEGIINYPIIY